MKMANNDSLCNEGAIEEVTLTTQTLALSASQVPNNYITAATSDNTRKAYQSDIRQFYNWGGLLPADVSSILRYLHDKAREVNHRTLSRHLTSLGQWHHLQGFDSPTKDPLVRKTLTGIKNTHGQPKKQAKAITIKDLITMVGYLNSKTDLISIRNNLLIQLGFFGAFRRSELVAIKCEDITFLEAGIEIVIPKSKTDQGRAGRVCAIPYGNETLCVIKALQIWQAQSQIKSGYVFRALNKKHHVKENPITDTHANYIIKQLAKECGLENPEQYSMHSLRRGFATEASRKGVPFKAIMQQGRWKSESTVLGYIEAGQRFDDNAVDVILKD